MSAPCDFGTLMLRNGPTLESPAFPGLFRDSEICDSHPIPRLITQGNRLFLRFQAGSTRIMHFRIRYEQFDSGCGGHITGFSGAISAPQFPHKDSQSLRCEWLVAVAPGNQIRLQIAQMDDLDSEDSQGKCSPFGRNLLEVAEETDWTELLRRHCRREMNPSPVQSRGNALSVRFTQHGGSHHPAIFGFLAYFSTVCSDIVLEGQQGTLQSPGYPQRVMEARMCQWTIRTSPGSRIHLQFHLFRVTDSSALSRFVDPMIIGRMSACRRNFLEIEPREIRRFRGIKDNQAFVVNETSGPREELPQRFCLNSARPMEMLSEHSQFRLAFQSRDEPENHFWLSWQTIGCGGTISLNNSLLLANASANADFVAGDSFRKCVWTIRAPLGHSIRVDVERLETEAMPNGKKCFELKAADELGGTGSEKAELRDGVQFYAGEFPFARLNSGGELPLKALCGRIRNEVFTWAGPNLAVVFSYHADTSQAIADKMVGAAVFGTQLEAVNDHVMFRARVTFHLVQSAVGIAGGGGGGAAEEQQQQGGIIHVDPRSDSFIQSPNYPQPYPKSIELMWQFEAPEGFRLAFQLLNLSSPASSVLAGYRPATARRLNTSDPEDYTCGYHLLYLRGGLLFIEGTTASAASNFLHYGNARYRICQDVLIRPVNIEMNGNLSVVTFRGAPYDQIVASSAFSSSLSSSAAQQRTAIGFRLRAYAKCGGNLVASAERKLLNTAQMAAGHVECEWQLKRSGSDTDAGQKIFVRVEELTTNSMQPQQSSSSGEQPAQVEVFCNFDSQGVIEAGNLLRSLDDANRGGDIQSQQQQHFREFVCDGEMRVLAKGLDRHEQTFLITYDTESTFCGGQLSGHVGRLALNPVPDPSDCEWTIATVPGGHVLASIVSLVLPVTEFCADSFVEFREVNGSGPLIGRYCGIYPSVVESQGSLWIRLRHKRERDDDDDDGAGGGGGEQTAAIAGGQQQTRPPVVKIKYTKVYGLTTSRVIESPPSGSMNEPIAWRIAANEQDHWIRVKFTDFRLAQFAASLNIYPIWCSAIAAGPEEKPCRDSDSLALHFTAASPPQRARLYTIRSSQATLVFSPNSYAYFRLEWEDTGEKTETTGGGEENGGTDTMTSSDTSSIFTCGGELTAQYEPQTLTNPRDEYNQIWYRNNERCKWIVRRPQFASILLNVTSLELEPHPSCQYDWLGLSTENYEREEELAEVPEMSRVCQKTSLRKGEVNSADQAFIYFVTDRSRTFQGFSLTYSLTCNSIELWPVEKGLLDTTLTSPGYPGRIPSMHNQSCQWSILLLSRREMRIQAMDMDLAPRDWQTQECVTESLEFSATPFYFHRVETTGGVNKSLVHCGQEQFNLTIPGGYLFIRHQKSGAGGGGAAGRRGRGFKLRLTELVHDCASALLQLDHLNARKVLTSPNFPHFAPDSLDCQWILSAPAGARLQFTIDPKTFRLQNPISEERCEEDYLEIRDGPSASSPLIGRYCKENAPSTVISTGEHLNVRFVTDSETQSPGWNATVELASCGGSIVLVPGQNASLQSPNYPDIYPSRVRCQWTIRAPSGHFVEAQLEHFWLANTENCTAESLTIRDLDANGDLLQKPVCSRLALTTAGIYRSSHQSMYVDFVVDGGGGTTASSTTSSLSSSFSRASSVGRTSRLFCLSRKCGFRLRLWSSKFACGGPVSDDAGRLFAPGYPDWLVPNLFCQWDFRAGIGNRYLLELGFPVQADQELLHVQADTNGRRMCFVGLEIVDGFAAGGRSNVIGQHFCVNSTTFVSKTDVLTMVYDGEELLGIDEGTTRGALMQRPFHVKYVKVPRDFDNSSCQFELTENGNVSIAGSGPGGRPSSASSFSAYAFNFARNPFCHIQIRKPSADSTMHIQMSKLHFGTSIFDNKSRKCEPKDSRILIRDEQSEPVDFQSTICKATMRGANRTELILLNSQVEIYVQNFFGQDLINFDLSVTFHECGGVLDVERVGMSGQVNSPGFGVSNYTNGLECIWLLRAPEGRVVLLEFTSMDLEPHIECAHDVLEVFAGEHRSAVIHRYCTSDNGEDKLAERFRRIRSVGRSLTLYFHTDSSVVGRGFSATFAFVPFDARPDQCGFHANSMNGSVQSPGFPADYPPNAKCLWDIQVPTGFHIRLTFDFFDIVQSMDCIHDFLKVSEEHQSRAVSPLLSYYFYFDHESPGQHLCGNTLPAPIDTESNRIRLNFTSDARKSAKGFKLHWQAVCGNAVLRNNHGVLTSPNYPASYPNEDALCNYMINPETQPGTTQIVTLKVLDLDLDPSTSTTRIQQQQQRRRGGGNGVACQSDYLQVMDVSRNVTVQLLCGATFQAEQANAVSVKGPIGVRFVTNYSISHETTGKNYRGFKLTYALADCGGDVNLGDGMRTSSTGISSPGFPLPYHHSLDCVWNVSAPADRIIAYKFTDLNIEYEPLCQFDAVEIFDGAMMSNESRQMRLCGNKAPDGEMKTSGPNMLIRFRSDHSASYDGFRMVLTATLGPAKGCGGKLNASKEWQRINAPINPETGRHFGNLRCEWTIQAPFGKLVEMRVTALDLESKLLSPAIAAALPSNLTSNGPARDRIPCFDYVAIYDGPKATSPYLLAPSCSLPTTPAGDQLLTSLVSSHKRVDVLFFSDPTMELAGGFNAEFRAINAECGGAMQAGQQWANVTYTGKRTLTRTNQRHQRCRWFLYSDQGQPVEVVFQQFSFPSTSPDCNDEFVELRDVGALSECEHPACVREPNQQKATTVRSCGQYAPPWHISSTSILQVTASMLLQSQFAASFSLRFRAFSACNRTIEIDGNAPNGISLAAGRLTSPNFPHSPYSHNATCTTEIVAGTAHRIFVVFKTFELERGRYMPPGRQRWRFDRNWLLNQRQRRQTTSRRRRRNRRVVVIGGTSSNTGADNCVYDSLTIIRSSDLNTSSRGDSTFCGSILPPSILSDANRLQLILKTDATVAGNGYELSYYSVAITSMANAMTPNMQMFELAPIRERSGSLSSIGFPTSPYPANALFRATIIPPLGLVCTVQVLRADFGGECRDSIGKFPARTALLRVDFLAREYPIPDFNQLEWRPLPCSVNSPLKLPIPVGNQLIVEFRSDSDPENDGIGFRMVWECEDQASIV